MALMARAILAALFAVSLATDVQVSVVDCGHGDADVLQGPVYDVKVSDSGGAFDGTKVFEVTASGNLQRNVEDVLLHASGTVLGRAVDRTLGVRVSSNFLEAGARSYIMRFEVPQSLFTLIGMVLPGASATVRLELTEKGDGFLCADIVASLGASQERAEPLTPRGDDFSCPAGPEEFSFEKAEDGFVLRSTAQLEHASLDLSAAIQFLGISIPAISVTGTATGSPYLMPQGAVTMSLYSPDPVPPVPTVDPSGDMFRGKLVVTNVDDGQVYWCSSTEAAERAVQFTV